MITRCTKKNSAVAVVLLVASAGATWWLYTYTAALQHDLYTKKEDIAQYEAQEKNLATAEKAAAAATADRQLLEEFLLTENETVTFLTNLEEAARSDGVVMETESLLVKDDRDVPYIELTLNGTGSQTSLAQFLQRLESLGYGGWIESLTWSRTDSGARADVTVHILLLPS